MPPWLEGEPRLGDGPAAAIGASARATVATPSVTELLGQLATSEARRKHLELQLEDCEQRGLQRLTELRQQHDAECVRLEFDCRKMQSELDRQREVNVGEQRRWRDAKQRLTQDSEVGKEAARREERRRLQLELEEEQQKHELQLEEEQRRHERAMSLAQQQVELEAESLRRAHVGEHQLSKLVEQVQTSVAEVQRMGTRMSSDWSLEWAVRERQLEAREKNVRDMEAGLSSQSKQLEDQRRRVEELLRHMEDSQVDDRSALGLERERLEAEHQRLLELQQAVREADRNNREGLRHSWSQLQDERHSFQQERMRQEGELQVRKETLEQQQRSVRQEVEHLRAVHAQIETVRQNAAGRVRETEATISSERRNLMHDVEVFEEKRRLHAAEREKLEADRRSLVKDKDHLEHEKASVGHMAAEVQVKSGELRHLHNQVAGARSELQALRGRLQEERAAQGSELERLRTTQTLVEKQRLQLLQSENQVRVRSLEDGDLVARQAQASLPPPTMALGGAPGGGSWSGSGSAASIGVGDMPPLLTGGDGAVAAQAAAAPLEALLAAALMAPGGGSTAAAVAADTSQALLQAALAPAAGGGGAAAASSSARAAAALPQRSQHLSPGASGPTSASTAAAAAAAAAKGRRMELQMRLRRHREASGEMDIYIQEQFHFLQEQQHMAMGDLLDDLGAAAAAAPYAASLWSSSSGAESEVPQLPPQLMAH